MKVYKRDKSGFTLIELSVVLVIIGLLAASIVGGNELVHAAKMKKVVKEINEIRTAVDSFVELYKYYPGDVPYATKFWPTTCVWQEDNESNCDGDGDWQIRNPSLITFPRENLRSWQHLGFAKLYREGFTGAPDIDYRYHAEENVPSSAVAGGVYGLHYIDPGKEIYGRVGNVINLGAIIADGTNIDAAVLSADDAIEIDDKIDDNDPDAGDVFVLRASEPDTGCTDNPKTSASANMSYGGGIECMLVYWIDHK